MTERMTSLEALIVERVLVAWLALEWSEVAFLDGIGQEHSRSQAEYWNWRVELCHRRFLVACRVVAQVQKVDVNVVLAQVGTTRGG
jgi:hypothetical protein